MLATEVCPNSKEVRQNSMVMTSHFNVFLVPEESTKFYVTKTAKRSL